MMLRWLVSNYLRNAAQQKLRDAVANTLQRQPSPDHDHPQEPPPPADVAILFALGIESGGLTDVLREVVTTDCESHREHVGWLGERCVVVAESGVGCEAAANTTREVISLHKPAWIISAGFAAALQPELRRGHVFLADEVVNATGHHLSIGLTVDRQSIAPTPALHMGRLLTVDHLIRTPDERKRLGEHHAALACDMETLAVAEVCQELQTAFLSVRIISDAVDDELPLEIEKLLAQTSLAGKLGAAAGALFQRPSSAKDWWQFQEDALKASDRLARFVTGIVAQLPPQSSPGQ